MPTTFHEWCSWAKKLDRQWREYQNVNKKVSQAPSQRTLHNSGQGNGHRQAGPPPPINTATKPVATVQVPNTVAGNTQARMRCFKCGNYGHLKKDCRSKQEVRAAWGDFLKECNAQKEAKDPEQGFVEEAQ